MSLKEFEEIVRFRRVDDNYYDVIVLGVNVGCVYCNPKAWSYGRWFIEGDRVELVSGGVCNKKCKPLGCKYRLQAAWKLSIMNSGKIVAARITA